MSEQDKQTAEKEGRDLYEWVQALVCSVLTVVLVFTFGIRLMDTPWSLPFRTGTGCW